MPTSKIFSAMDVNNLFGETDGLDIVKDPFTKNGVTGITIYMGKHILMGDFYFRGYVDFCNGQTQGKQIFEGSNLVDVFIKVRNFCMSLK